jgi:hypothetical protein
VSRAQAANPSPPALVARLLKAFDADADGRLSLSEFFAANLRIYDEEAGPPHAATDDLVGPRAQLQRACASRPPPRLADASASVAKLFSALHFDDLKNLRRWMERSGRPVRVYDRDLLKAPDVSKELSKTSTLVSAADAKAPHSPKGALKDSKDFSNQSLNVYHPPPSPSPF